MKCGECINFTGMGDWNLSCKIQHPTLGEVIRGVSFPCGHLCHENTPACDAFDPMHKMNEAEFIEKFCHHCGSQRCEGIGTEWFDGCQNKKFLEEK